MEYKSFKRNCKRLLKQFWNFLTYAFSQLVSISTDLLKQIRFWIQLGVSKAARWIGHLLWSIYQWIKQKIYNLWQAFTNLLSSLLEAIKARLNALTRAIKDKGWEWYSLIKSKVDEQWLRFINWLKQKQYYPHIVKTQEQLIQIKNKIQESPTYEASLQKSKALSKEPIFQTYLKALLWTSVLYLPYAYSIYFYTPNTQTPLFWDFIVLFSFFMVVFGPTIVFPSFFSLFLLHFFIQRFYGKGSLRILIVLFLLGILSIIMLPLVYLSTYVGDEFFQWMPSLEWMDRTLLSYVVIPFTFGIAGMLYLFSVFLIQLFFIRNSLINMKTWILAYSVGGFCAAYLVGFEMVLTSSFYQGTIASQIPLSSVYNPIVSFLINATAPLPAIWLLMRAWKNNKKPPVTTDSTNELVSENSIRN